MDHILPTHVHRKKGIGGIAMGSLDLSMYLNEKRERVHEWRVRPSSQSHYNRPENGQNIEATVMKASGLICMKLSTSFFLQRSLVFLSLPRGQ